MRQRVLLAVALASEPDLLIADEPTTALDATIQAQILDLLLKLRDRRGLSMLLISHDLGVVAEVCDRVAVMYSGQIVETGPTPEVLRRPAHPYTEGLLGCLPRLGEPGRPLAPIPGSVPAIGTRLRGCRFAPRCRWAVARCHVDPPHLEEVEGAGPERLSRCWLSNELIGVRD
jgi:oligopeptide/dipeptide ABC transporter ATP-binding protein